MPLIANRSMPSSSVIPVLEYPFVRDAADWLCRAFGFEERLRSGGHRTQLTHAGGAIIIAQATPPASTTSGERHSLMIRVAQLEEHYERALKAGTRILAGPTSYPYGELQYTAEDPWAHRWTFSQTLRDVDPVLWGGTLLAAERN